MLHSVTPHHHTRLSESLSFSQEHECPNNFLSDIFQFDLGVNHLEEFEITKNQPDVPFGLDMAVLFEWTITAFEIRQEKPAFQQVSIPTNHQYLAGTHTLRAPPIFIV